MSLSFGVPLTYSAIKFVAFLWFSQNFIMIIQHTSANHVQKIESIPQIVSELFCSENWSWIAPKLSEVWYFEFGVLLTYTAIKFDTLFGFSQNFYTKTHWTPTTHVAKFGSIPWILSELLHFKSWCVFLGTPDIMQLCDTCYAAITLSFYQEHLSLRRFDLILYMGRKPSSNI